MKLSIAAAQAAASRALAALSLALGLALSIAAAPASAAGTLGVTFGSDANFSFFAAPGDFFAITGNGGFVTLTDGVAQDVGITATSESLTCCFWDDQLYSNTVNHTVTLNGVSHGYSQTWNVFDFIGPTSSVGAGGTQVFNLAGGTVAVTLNGGNGFAAQTATLLFSADVPEPATWALMIGGFGLAGAVLRRRVVAA